MKQLKHFIYPITFILIIGPKLLFAFEIGEDSKICYSDSLYKVETQAEVKKKVEAYLNGFVGLYQNKTFGAHPTFGANIGAKFRKSFIYLLSEFRFGKSKNPYDVVINDSIISTNYYYYYYGQYIGLAYDQKLITKKKHEVNSIVGLGFDKIKLPNIDDEDRFNEGYAFTLGIGYLYKIKNKSGPSVQLIYQYSQIDTEGGTKPNENSFILRFTYMF